MATLSPIPKPQFFDNDGRPLDGGKLYTYRAGTSTPLSTYTDQSGDTPNENPIILDEAGRCDLWLGDDVYKYIMKDADDNTLWTVDDISAASSEGGESIGGWSEHAITDGQSAADLEGEEIDFALYEQAIYTASILRGTTVLAEYGFNVQRLNGTERIIEKMTWDEVAHGVTFTLSMTGDVAQLRAACDAGAGDGTIKLRRTLVPA